MESQVLQQFYERLQIVLPIDELLPRLVSKKIIAINDKILITESGRNINERCRFFLDHYIAKPLSAGDPTPFYKLLQAMDTSVNGIALATKIQQSLMIESLQDKISGKFEVGYIHIMYVYTLYLHGLSINMHNNLIFYYLKTRRCFYTIPCIIIICIVIV